MDRDAVLGIIDDFKTAIERRGIRIRQLILYGSYAAGTYKPGSDIDLVVISEDFADKGYWERIELLTDAIYEVFQPIEAVAFTPAEWDRKESLIAHYAKDGEIVYAA